MAEEPCAILLIEDDEEDFMITEDLLDEAADEYVLTWVASYDEGLERLAVGEFDVCLVDYRLGSHTGLDVIRSARANGHTVPMILLTGLGGEEIDRAALEAGASDYLVKNKLTADTLERTIRYACNQASLTKELSHHAHHDVVTGTANRKMFTDRLRDSLANAERSGQITSLIFLDLDDFKRVNDSHGHAIGDLLLKQVADRLTRSTRSCDLVARFGGDEFAVFADHSRDEKLEGLRLAQRIVALLAEPYDIDGIRVDITCSVGVAVDTGTGTTPDTLTTHADVALYQAKRQGKNSVALFEDSMHQALREELELRNDYTFGIEREEFFVEYQPIIAPATNALVGFEALARWNHPTRGVVGPNTFIPIAETSGRIDSLASYVLKKSCDAAAKMTARTGLSPLISVNVSPRQLTETSILDAVSGSLESSGIDPGRLVLEITESAMMRDFSVASRHVDWLKDMGVRIALDDFGSGFSSLNQLHRLPLDFLKLDRMFVCDAAQNERAACIVRSVADMCRSLEITAIAEGVETAEDHAFVLDVGFELAQGYHYARPVARDHAIAVLMKTRSRLAA